MGMKATMMSPFILGRDNRLDGHSHGFPPWAAAEHRPAQGGGDAPPHGECEKCRQGAERRDGRRADRCHNALSFGNGQFFSGGAASAVEVVSVLNAIQKEVTSKLAQ